MSCMVYRKGKPLTSSTCLLNLCTLICCLTIYYFHLTGNEVFIWLGIKFKVSPQLINWHHIDWLVEERRSSIAKAMELRLSCTKPLICVCLRSCSCIGALYAHCGSHMLYLSILVFISGLCWHSSDCRNCLGDKYASSWKSVTYKRNIYVVAEHQHRLLMSHLLTCWWLPTLILSISFEIEVIFSDIHYHLEWHIYYKYSVDSK